MPTVIKAPTFDKPPVSWFFCTGMMNAARSIIVIKAML